MLLRFPHAGQVHCGNVHFKATAVKAFKVLEQAFPSAVADVCLCGKALQERRAVWVAAVVSQQPRTFLKLEFKLARAKLRRFVHADDIPFAKHGRVFVEGCNLKRIGHSLPLGLGTPDTRPLQRGPFRSHGVALRFPVVGNDLSRVAKRFHLLPLRALKVLHSL